MQYRSRCNRPSLGHYIVLLHIAVQRKDYAFAKRLCDKPQINLDARCCDGLTTYGMAFRMDDKPTMDILRTNRTSCGELKVTNIWSIEEEDKI